MRPLNTHFQPVWQFPAIFLLPLCVLFDTPACAQNLTVIFPKDSTHVISSDSIFVYGNSDFKAEKVVINGQRARLFPNKSYVSMIPVAPGQNRIEVLAMTSRDTVRAKRTVWVPPFLIESPIHPSEIDTTYFQTYRDLEIRQGDSLVVLTKASPHQRVFLHIAGLIATRRMHELHPRRRPQWTNQLFLSGDSPALPPVRGLYATLIRIQNDVPAGEYSLRFLLQKAKGDTIVAMPATKLLVRERSYRQHARLRTATIVVDESSNNLKSVYLDQNTEVELIGKSGRQVRVQLTPARFLWMEADELRFLSNGNPGADRTALKLVSIDSTEKWLQFRFSQTRRVPFEIEQSSDPTKLIVRFFDAAFLSEQANFDHMLPITFENHQHAAEFVFQRKSAQQWGYRRFYQDSLFVLEIKREPEFADASKPLADRTILLDAGHGPDTGSIGATGLQEQHATAETAIVLKEMLQRESAKVVLSREPAAGINLASRTVFAEAIDADIFVSLHYNALPASVNPIRSRGTSSYYYHPQSQALAEALQARLLSATRLRNFGVFQRNLAVCRTSSMPAVLLEPAFIMIPSEEQQIRDPAFIERLCEGIVAGMRDFIQSAKRSSGR